MKSLLLFVSAFFFCVQLAFGQNVTVIEITPTVTPRFVFITGRPTLYYELRITSQAIDSVAFTQLQILDGKDSAVYASYNKSDLNKRLAFTGTASQVSSHRIYIELEFTGNKQPSILRHQLTVEAADKKTRTIGGPIVRPENGQTILGAPLEGGPWAAVYDPAWQRGHRRVVFTVDGKEKIPGRFAIDFIKLDDDGKYTKANEDDISTWYGYASKVLAVADGVVASTRDDFAESKTLAAHPDYPAEKATGNYIAIDIGNGQFVFYEHLKPRSITVKPGQKVKKGDVIASLGFTGQSTGPHLHFHLADTNSPLGAEGIPFVFEQFRLLGIYPNFENFGKSRWVPVENKNSRIKNERPSSNTVITF